MRFLIAVLACLLLALQYALWFGDKNLFDLHRLSAATEQTRQDSLQLQQRNDQLVTEVIDLKEGGETVETLARSQFGFIKPGEVFYQIVDE